MNSGLIYKALAEKFTKGNIKELERQLGFSGSSISKAIDRKSTIKPSTIDLILQKFPVVNQLWLMTGQGEMILNEDKALYGVSPNLKSNDQVVQAATIKALINEVAKIKAKLFEMKLDDCLMEIEQNTTLILKDMLIKK